LCSIVPHYYPQFWSQCFHFVSTLPHQSRQSVASALSFPRNRVRVSGERNVHFA